jgi:hypothetical protein
VNFDIQEMQVLTRPEKAILRSLKEIAETRVDQHIEELVRLAKRKDRSLNTMFKSEEEFYRLVASLAIAKDHAFHPDGYAVRIADSRGLLLPLPPASSPESSRRTKLQQAVRLSSLSRARLESLGPIARPQRCGKPVQSLQADDDHCSNPSPDSLGRARPLRSAKATPVGIARRKSHALKKGHHS